MKSPIKQQVVAAFENSHEISLEEVLKRWGLESANYYLAKPGHAKAIGQLAANPGSAAKLIDQAMRKARLPDTAGVGLKIRYLQEHFARGAREAVTEAAKESRREREVVRRAESIAKRIASEGTPVPVAVAPEVAESLVRRGLERFGESDDVIRALEIDVAARQGLIASELERESLERELDAMSDIEFQTCCERLFFTSTGLRRLFGEAPRASSGLRLVLLEFLLKERKKATSNANATGLDKR